VEGYSCKTGRGRRIKKVLPENLSFQGEMIGGGKSSKDNDNDLKKENQNKSHGESRCKGNVTQVEGGQGENSRKTAQKSQNGPEGEKKEGGTGKAEFPFGGRPMCANVFLPSIPRNFGIISLNWGRAIAREGTWGGRKKQTRSQKETHGGERGFRGRNSKTCRANYKEREGREPQK